MNDRDNTSSVLKIPLIVGISGHISIDESETYISGQLEKFWNHLRSITGPETPIVLLSSIAAGADHYAVKYRPDDVKYIAVLPFNEEDYRKDFGSGETLDNYVKDLTGANKTIICDAPSGDYSAASDYIRQRSDVLLTVWDGKAALDHDGNPKKGGTYYLINKAFHIDDLLTPDPEKLHLVVNLSVSRNGNAGKTMAKLSSALDVLSWDEDSSSFYGTPFEQFNLESEDASRKDTEKYSVISALKEMIVANRISHDTIEKDAWLEADILNSGTDRALQQKKLNAVMDDFERYSYHDKQALKHQRRYWKQFNLVLAISFAAAICSQISGGVTFSTEDSLNSAWVNVFISLFLSGLLIAFLIQKFYINKTDDYRIYCNHRVIAELMRLKIFWKLAGIKEEFSSMVLAESGNFFCALPVCNWEICDPAIHSSAIGEECHQQMPTVRKAWLQSQLDYYRKTSVPRFLRWDRNVRKWAKIFYGISMGMSVFFLLHYIFFSSVNLLAWCGLDLTHYTEVIVGIGPFIFASLGWLLEKKQWNEIAENYEKTAGYFELTLKKFDKLDKELSAGNITEEYATAYRQHLIKELMQLCHEENSEWKSIKSNAKPEPMI